jgi:hypothetical protein
MMEKTMLTCKEISWLSSKTLDVKLPLIKRIQMAMHITLCKACYRYRSQLKTLHLMVKKSAPYFDDIDACETGTLSSESKERIKNFLQQNML